jgi:coenzyme F420-0:L-glutamate ligase/coenzyme F420-1:gamma-L-glutamate ligase
MIQVIPVRGLPEIRPGHNLGKAVVEALSGAGGAGSPGDTGGRLETGDVVVVTSKAVSKAEGRTVVLDEVTPSALAWDWAERHGKDARQVEVVLRESRRIVRMDRGVLIAETHHGFVCANAGVDASNVGAAGELILLPLDPDASARNLREDLRRRTGADVAVVVSDTFGRPWRTGQTNIAIGCAGIAALHSYAGSVDPAGHLLVATTIAVIDELAGAAELVMGKLDRVPVAVVRGYSYSVPEAGEPDPGASPLVRQAEFDLFR